MGFANGVMNAINTNFGTVANGQREIVSPGQLMIGTGNLTPLPEIVAGFLTSTGGTIAVTNGPGTINLEVIAAPGAILQVPVQSITAPGVTPVVPTGLGVLSISGASVAALAVPVQSRSIALNSLQIEVQRGSQQAASASANAGLLSANSAHFLVDGNGWLSNLNGLSASSFPVQAVTAPGVSPVLPSALGVVSISGAAVAAGLIPIQSRSIALNSLQIEVQRAASSALTNATQQGLSSYNSAHFLVDANGWVSSVAAPITWLESAGGLLLVQTGYFANAAAVYTLPAAPTIGQIVEIIAQVAGGVVVTANAGQTIRLQNVPSSVAGTCTNTQIGDGLRLVYRAANTEWQCNPGAGGNWLLA